MDGHEAVDVKQVLELSAEMLAVAAQGDWDKATSLQHDCDARIRRIPQQPSVLEALRQLQRDQQAMLTMAARARDAVADAMARNRTNYRAVSAYLTTSSVADEG
jgi:hypothetical protein